MSTLKVKKIGIDTYQENIAYLPQCSEIVRSQGFAALSKIEIHSAEKNILATLNITQDNLVSHDEIGLSDIAFTRMGLEPGAEVTLSHPNPLVSTDYIREKLEGAVLSKEKFLEIMKDILAHRYSNIELTAFVVACAQQTLNEDEIVALTEAMIETGERIDWGLPLVLDKHCIGGIPGNRTTMIVVPIIAAYGLPIPKTSSRAITSPSGTADTMEVIAEVQFTLEEMAAIVGEENACIVWGGALALAPADDIIISVERPLNIDSEAQMIASILSKKKAAGSHRMLLDIPVGPTAKIKSIEEAKHLKVLFQNVGNRIGLQVRVIFSDGTQPVGQGIGPLLEAQDVLKVLENSPEAPQDLREKSIFIAGELLELSGSVKAGEGIKIAGEILRSGAALQKFQSIARRQGLRKAPKMAAYTSLIKSPVSGVLKAIHNKKIAKVAKLAGAPQDPSAGVYLHHKVGEKIALDEGLFTVYAETQEELQFSCDYVAANPDIFFIE